MDLDDYEVTFSRNSLFGWWTYRVTTPSGDTLLPLMGNFTDKANAERAAMRRIELHQARETVSATELQQRLKT